jgi:hypothetical protein
MAQMARTKKKILTTDNDAAVRTVMSEEFLTMPDLEAVNVGLALQEIIRGQRAIGDDVAKLKAQMDKYDKDAAKFNENQEKFRAEVMDKASKLKATGAKKDKYIAEGTIEYQKLIQKAKAINATDKARFEEAMRTQPKVKYTSPGRWESGSVSGGAPQNVIVPEEVRIKHMRWVLPVGREVEIPTSVMEVLNNRRKTEMENQERQEALSKLMDNDELTKKNTEISNKYKTNAVKPFQPIEE